MKAKCIDCGSDVSAPHVKRCQPCFNKYRDMVGLEHYGRLRHDNLCIVCGAPVKHRSAKRCGKCYSADRLGDKNPKWRGSSICPNCGKNKGHSARAGGLCMECYKTTLHHLPTCINCGKPLSRYLGLTSGYCQQCYKGDKTNRWNPELTEIDRQTKRSANPKYREWRTAVFERDGYTCQCCGDSKGGNLVSHHIQSWKTTHSLRFDIDNGITLCDKCHRAFHRKHSYYNNNRGQLLDFIRVF